jgi:hypothetical protein
MTLKRLEKSVMDADEQMLAFAVLRALACFPRAECILKQRLQSPGAEVFKAAAICNRLSVEICLLPASRMILKTAFGYLQQTQNPGRVHSRQIYPVMETNLNPL